MAEYKDYNGAAVTVGDQLTVLKDINDNETGQLAINRDAVVIVVGLETPSNNVSVSYRTKTLVIDTTNTEIKTKSPE